MTVQTRINIKPHIILSVLLLAFCSSLCFVTVKMTAYADNGDFNIDAQLLPSKGDTYNISVTVENMGDDWEGIVRLLRIDYGDDLDDVYDTAVSLPQGSVKQFVVKISKYSYIDLYGSHMDDDIEVRLIDKKSKTIFSQKFSDFLFQEENVLNMGILSDDYSSLTFMDMGGDKLDFYGKQCFIKLVELNQDALSDMLDSLNFLVIDKYDTAILTDDDIDAIEEWNNNGGVLIVGTGKYAEDTLAGMDYLNIGFSKVYDAEDNPYSYSESGYGSGIDIEKLDIAELVYPDYLYYEADYNRVLIMSTRNGAVGVLPYSLSELGELGIDAYHYTTQSDFVYTILDHISCGVNGSLAYSLYYEKDYKYYMQKMFLSVIGNGGNTLNFGALKLIIIIYVILAGPVLYLILRSLKKRDLYWLTVPALSLAGIVIVMFVGRGFEIMLTKVYSVTVCDLSGLEDCTTYLHCYDANHSEWSLHLSQDYEYAAPIVMDKEYTSGYHYRILQEGGRLSFGVKPHTGFEDVYFCAGKNEDMQGIGSIECNVDLNNKTVNKVTNNTEYDFEYLAVVDADHIRVYNGIAAGESCSPDKMKEIFQVNTGGYYLESYYMSNAQDAMQTDNLDSIAALGIGIGSAFVYIGADRVAVIGVVPDYIKAVDDNCSEEAYGCFYIIQ